MHGTAQTLQAMAAIIALDGLHTGEQMATLGPPITLDISALAYAVAEDQVPDAFFTDEATSLQLIEASPRAMAVLHAISAAIDNYEVPDSAGRPDVIEHVSQWTFTTPIGCTRPPTTAEVIGCILRAAKHAATHTPAA